MKRERDKLDRTLGGIREMTRTPSAVWIVDTKKEHLAVEEARKLRIPIIGILDTNCDPDEVDFPIPGNDDAIRAVGLLTRVVADAVADGLIARSGAKTAEGEGEAIASEEPLPEWERELLQGDADAASPPLFRRPAVSPPGPPTRRLPPRRPVRRPRPPRRPLQPQPAAAEPTAEAPAAARAGHRAGSRTAVERDVREAEQPAEGEKPA